MEIFQPTVNYRRRYTVARSRILFRRVVMEQKAREIFRYGDSVYSDTYDRLKCIFIHIPKCAGTSVGKILYDQTPWHYTAENLRFINETKFDQHYRFAIIRCPWARLFSIYRYAPIDTQKYWFSPLKFVTKFKTFEAFVDYGLNEYIVQKHQFFAPQTSYVNINDVLSVDTIVRLENLNEDMRAVFERFPRLDRSIPHLNDSGPPPNLNDIYNCKMRKKISELYKSDLTTFGYSFGGQ